MRIENGFFYKINPFKKDLIGEDIDSGILKNRQRAKKLLDQAKQFMAEGDEIKAQKLYRKAVR